MPHPAGPQSDVRCGSGQLAASPAAPPGSAPPPHLRRGYRGAAGAWGCSRLPDRDPRPRSRETSGHGASGSGREKLSAATRGGSTRGRGASRVPAGTSARRNPGGALGHAHSVWVTPTLPGPRPQRPGPGPAAAAPPFALQGARPSRCGAPRCGRAACLPFSPSFRPLPDSSTGVAGPAVSQEPHV